MQRPGPWTRKRWIALGVIVGLIGGLGVFLAWPGRDPWPPRLLITLPNGHQPIGFSTHERSFQTSDSNAIVDWDLATGQPIEPAPTAWLWQQNLSRDGRSFVAIVADETGSQQTIVLGDYATAKILRRFPLAPHRLARRVGLIDDDRQIRAFVQQRNNAMEVITWDVASGVETTRPIAGPGPGVKAPLGFSPDGRTWAYWDSTRNGVQLWDSEADRALGPLLPTSTPPPAPGWSWVATAFTPDGRTLLLGRADGQVEFWDVARLSWIKTVRLYPSDHLVFYLQVAPDGRTLITTGVVPPPVKPAVIAAALAEVRRWVWGVPRWDQDSELIITDLATDQPLARLSRTSVGGVSRDGRTIVTLDRNQTLSVRAIPQPQGQRPPRRPDR